MCSRKMEKKILFPNMSQFETETTQVFAKASAKDRQRASHTYRKLKSLLSKLECSCTAHVHIRASRRVVTFPNLHRARTRPQREVNRSEMKSNLPFPATCLSVSPWGRIFPPVDFRSNRSSRALRGSYGIQTYFL